MSRSTNTVTTWKPTPQQREAARQLAAGSTWQATADRVGIKSLQTIANWLKDERFLELKDAYSARLDDYLEDELVGSLADMFRLWRAWVRGEGVDADDARIPHIKGTITRYIERFYEIDDAPVSPQAPGVAVQVNVNRDRNDAA